MKAFLRTQTGISLQDVDIPVPGAHEILVKVHASALNRADLALADGKAHGQHGGTGTPLGLEWAGEVVKVGAAVTAYRAGDVVMCSGMGGFAEFAVADWRRAFPIPHTLDFARAACLPIALRTSHTALTQLGQLQPGQSVLVLGASSGVGLMCLQVAKALGAGLVIGSSTQAERRARLHEFGADVTLDSGDPSWVAQVQDATAQRGADVLVDFLAGPLINDSMRATAVGGRIVNVGRMAGETGIFDFDLHSLRRIQYCGMTFRTRTHENIGEIAQRVRADLWSAVEAGAIGLPIDVRMPLEAANEALALMRRNTHFGKIILTP